MFGNQFISQKNIKDVRSENESTYSTPWKVNWCLAQVALAIALPSDPARMCQQKGCLFIDTIHKPLASKLEVN